MVDDETEDDEEEMVDDEMMVDEDEMVVVSGEIIIQLYSFVISFLFCEMIRGGEEEKKSHFSFQK